MSINNESRRTPAYFGDGLITSFPFTFKLFSGDQALVVLSSAITGTIDLTYNVDYTIALNVDQNTAPGGTVTLLQPLGYGYALVIKSAVPYTQLMQLTNNGGFYPTVLNDMADKQTMLIQQVIDAFLHPDEATAIQRVSYADNFAVTGTAVHITFPSAEFVIEPTIYVCINGAATDVSWLFNTTVVGAGSYYSSIDLTFKSAAIGKSFSLIVVSNG